MKAYPSLQRGSARTAGRLAPALVLALLTTTSAAAYPLDGFERTGLKRLVGYAKVQFDEAHRGLKLPPGALLGVDEVQLNLKGKNETWDLLGVEKDAQLQASLESIFKNRDSSYAVTVIDFTDPENIRWAGLREEKTQYPGSVGKTLTMVAFFDALARAFPDEARRLKLLKEHRVEASDWIHSDSHSVPKYDEESGRNRHSPIRLGETYTLSEWIDHMVSPSSNAAGAMVWKEAMLLRHFGAEYPPSAEQEKAFWSTTSKSALQELSLKVILDPLVAAGLDTEQLRQGSFWTRTGKGRVPGVQSYGSPRELARLLLRLEQGRLVDAWSSHEMKRYLYFTKKRYRYAYPEELHPAAVYFKSGSLYSCREEEGFRCGKYRGNERNFMNSIALVESPSKPGPEQRRYAVALLSNVLRKNSAWDHARLAAAIDAAVKAQGKPVEVVESGSSGKVAESGTSH